MEARDRFLVAFFLIFRVHGYGMCDVKSVAHAPYKVSEVRSYRQVYALRLPRPGRRPSRVGRVGDGVLWSLAAGEWRVAAGPGRNTVHLSWAFACYCILRRMLCVVLTHAG